MAHELSVGFSHHVVLRNVSHAFAPGRWTHIIGPNGAGKSTWIRALLGILEPMSGTVTLDGMDVSRLTAMQRARRMAYVPQRLEALTHVRVSEFVAQGAFALPMTADATPAFLHARVRDALSLLGIEHLAWQYLDEISGGERQLCTLASAFVQNSDVVVFDEPTSALDFKHVLAFERAVRVWNARQKTVISACHDLEFVARTADETIVLSHGEICWHGAGFPDLPTLARAYDAPELAFRRVCARADAPPSMPYAPDDAPPPSTSKVNDAPTPSTSKASKDTSVRPAVLAVAGIFVTCVCLLPWIGATWVCPWGDALQSHIFWQLRIPRVLWGAVAGGVLAMVGAAFQALFQNPLATPYTVGVASGASLGALAAIQFGISSMFGVPVAACVGGVMVMAVVMAVSVRFPSRSSITCLLSGVGASMFCTALGMTLQAFAAPLTAQQMMRWQLGGLEIAGYSTLAVFPFLLLAMGLLWRTAQRLNLMSIDTELSQTRGVNVQRTRIVVLAAACLATSVVVSVCGPIGFVGLIVPHVVRRMFAADLRMVLPVSAALGAVFLMLADAGARILETIAWVPVGVIVSLVGAPIFLYILTARTRK